MQDDGNPIKDFRIPEGSGEKLELFGFTAPFDPWDVLEQARKEFTARAERQALDETEAEAGSLFEQMQDAELRLAELLPYAEYEEAGHALMESFGIDPGSESIKEDAANLFFKWARARLRIAALQDAEPLATLKWLDTPHGTKYNADELYELRRRTWEEHRTERHRDVRELMRDLQGAAEAARYDYGVLLAKTQADPSDTLTMRSAADAWINLQRLSARLQAIEDLHKHMVEVGKPPSYEEWYFGLDPLPEQEKNGQSGDEELGAYTDTQEGKPARSEKFNLSRAELERAWSDRSARVRLIYEKRFEFGAGWSEQYDGICEEAQRFGLRKPYKNHKSMKAALWRFGKENEV